MKLEKIVRGMLRYKAVILAVFLLASALGLVLSFGVRVNYNMADYLPESAPSTVALDVMEAEYDSAVPNLRIMVPDVTIPEALELKDRFGAVPGVSDVSWLDDYISIKVPLKTFDAATVEEWYLDGAALFSMAVDDTPAIQEAALIELRAIVGDEAAMAGSPVDDVVTRKASGDEVAQIMAYILPIVFFILFITTKSWIEPVLFMCNVGVAVALNMGTNFFLGEISNITQTTASILQMACSMDYGIFFLDRFAEFRQEGLAPQEALVQSVTKSTTSILSSGMTTVVGFAALIVMQFRIGADMGFVLAKGIVCSLLTTILFMPCLTALLYPLIDKTSHRSFLPSFDKLGRATDKIKVFTSVAILLALVPSYLASQQNSFLYGMESAVSDISQEAVERNRINDAFGKSNAFVLLVPKGEMANEVALADQLGAMAGVTSILSYAETVGNAIPQSFLPDALLEQLNSDTYTRIVVNTTVPSEGAAAFAFVEEVRALAASYYGEDYHLAGESVTIYDMKDTITSDSVYVNLLTVGAIGIILLLTFKSLTLPIVLLLTIESAIFINFAIPYFTGQSLNYIGYLVISSVSLGATVDYAILFTNRYFENRQTMPRKQTAWRTISDTASSIFTSGGILITAGVVLGIISSNAIISQLGSLLGRGAALSVLFVIVFLPAQLVALEPVIKRTTIGMKFHDGEQQTQEDEGNHTQKKDSKLRQLFRKKVRV